MLPEAQTSDIEAATWRAEFEGLGRETVRLAIYRGQGLSPDRKRELAILWLREKELETEERERVQLRYVKLTFAAAVVAVFAAALGIVLMLIGS